MSEKLCEKLNYQFNDKKLLKLALTHRSSNELNNERLEFLGDAIVNFIIAEALFHKFPTSQEGELSRWRATLINRETLADMARGFDIGSYLFLGPGELKSGGNQRESILSCAMEAIIGAIYLDKGFEAARVCILGWYEGLLQSLTSAASHKDPKTILQEYLQSMRKPLPVYLVESVEGEAHQQVFVVSCQVTGMSKKALGKGTSRRRAEQDAAEQMLGIIKNE
jgi:ribonuclease III